MVVDALLMGGPLDGIRHGVTGLSHEILFPIMSPRNLPYHEARIEYAPMCPVARYRRHAENLYHYEGLKFSRKPIYGDEIAGEAHTWQSKTSYDASHGKDVDFLTKMMIGVRQGLLYEVAGFITPPEFFGSLWFFEETVPVDPFTLELRARAVLLIRKQLK